MSNWQKNIIEDDAGMKRILQECKVIAVVGMKDGKGQPALTVPRYMSQNGYTIIPVNPKLNLLLGQRCYPKLADVPDAIDLVLVFRRSEYCLEHAREALAVNPKVFWMQSGIRNPDAAELLARNGIRVVQDRCIYLEHAAHGAM